MIEAGVVVDITGKPFYWHLPARRTVMSLPDSRQLWDVFWEQHTKRNLLGFAHTHPGYGLPGPSWTDITTFAAIESALGRRIWWWILSEDCTIELRKDPTTQDKYIYSSYEVRHEPPWANELRQLSK